MALVDLIIPKMGESVTEATIQEWLKEVGDRIEMDEDVVATATDKVEATVPSHVEGVLHEILVPAGETVPVGTVVARIATGGEEESTTHNESIEDAEVEKSEPATEIVDAVKTAEAPLTPVEIVNDYTSASRFYSPLVKSIAKKEGVALSELENLQGSGANGRVTKKDILAYLATRKEQGAVAQPVFVTPVSEPVATKTSIAKETPKKTALQTTSQPAKEYVAGAQEEIIEMDRVRKLIAKHMVHSKQTAPHVTSYVEADVTNLFNWRNRIKGEFQKRYNEKITFTPIFIEAVAKALRDFPMVNVSVLGDDKILVKKYINIGMAAAMPNGNLIVPVVKNADQLNLAGLAKSVNDLANRARKNQLKPDEISGGTFTLTNVGTFGNLSGTPIINQPQVAIMSTGVIKKKPAVLETEHGDVIAVRQMMMMSLSYDHRVVDGFLGGSFLRRVADYLEQFDPNRDF